MSYLFDLLSFSPAAYPDAIGNAAGCVSADVFPFRVDPGAFQKSFPEKEDQDQGEAFSAFLAAVYSPEDVIRDIGFRTLTKAGTQVLKIYDEYMGRYSFKCGVSFSGHTQSLRRNIEKRFFGVGLCLGLLSYANLSSIKRSIEEICFYIYVKAQINREHGVLIHSKLDHLL